MALPDKMLQASSALLIVLAGLVNLLPVSGVLSAKRLQALYGVVLEDTNLLILMRHRAILFGIVGGLLLASAFHLPLRRVGLSIGLISMLSFVLIAGLVGGYNAELQRIIVFDLAASVALVCSALLDHFATRK